MGTSSLASAADGVGVRWPTLPWATWVIAAAFFLVLLPKIDSGTLWHHDELLTANRSREMLVRGDPFIVTLNFAPSVKKPPLQYWCGALLLRGMPDLPEMALRLPTLVCGSLCLLAAASLARACFPSDAALAVWSVVALAGCGYLILYSRVAMLDTGAAMFFTLALVGCRLARSDPRWWWFVSCQCILGAWQKAPYGLAAWLIFLLLGRWTNHVPTNDAKESPLRWRHHLPLAFALGLVGSLGWWIVQWWRVDHALLVAATQEQATMFLRAHDGDDQGVRPWVYLLWILRDWALVGVAALVGTGAALHMTRGGGGSTVLAWTCALFGGVMACFPYRAERYLVIVTPALAVLGVAWLRATSRRLPPALRRWVLPVFCATALPVAAFHYLKPTPRMTDLRSAAQALSRTLRPDERIFVCTDSLAGFEVPDFVLFYAGLRRPLEALPLQAILDSGGSATPRRGLCNRSQWDRLNRAQPRLKSVFTAGDWVLWSD